MTGFEPWTAGVGSDRSANLSHNHCPSPKIFDSLETNNSFNYLPMRLPGQIGISWLWEQTSSNEGKCITGTVASVQRWHRRTKLCRDDHAEN